MTNWTAGLGIAAAGRTQRFREDAHINSNLREYLTPLGAGHAGGRHHAADRPTSRCTRGLRLARSPVEPTRPFWALRVTRDEYSAFGIDRVCFLGHVSDRIQFFRGF